MNSVLCIFVIMFAQPVCAQFCGKYGCNLYCNNTDMVHFICEQPDDSIENLFLQNNFLNYLNVNQLKNCYTSLKYVNVLGNSRDIAVKCSKGVRAIWNCAAGYCQAPRTCCFENIFSKPVVCQKKKSNKEHKKTECVAAGMASLGAGFTLSTVILAIPDTVEKSKAAKRENQTFGAVNEMPGENSVHQRCSASPQPPSEEAPLVPFVEHGDNVSDYCTIEPKNLNFTKYPEVGDISGIWY